MLFYNVENERLTLYDVTSTSVIYSLYCGS